MAYVSMHHINNSETTFFQLIILSKIWVWHDRFKQNADKLSSQTGTPISIQVFIHSTRLHTETICSVPSAANASTLHIKARHHMHILLPYANQVKSNPFNSIYPYPFVNWNQLWHDIVYAL